jgi:Fe(II)/alpha-ketoglutarate-dependent arginine beta-hydroxylase
MNTISLTAEEVGHLKALLAEMTARYSSVDDPAFLQEAALIAHELPRRIRVFLHNFKQLELLPGACMIRSYPIDDKRIGPTPDHWASRPNISQTLEEEMLFVLFGSLLGDVIGWASQQNGYVIHDVLPIKTDEDEQISTGSNQEIWWHNEDAFHPYRGDYVSLMCLRNPYNTPTTYASMDTIKLSPCHLKTLFEPRFIIRPDDSHSEQRGADVEPASDDLSEVRTTAYQHIHEMHVHPEKLALLSGDMKSPYIRIDPYFMNPPDDDEAQSALNALIKAVDAALSEVILQPGDFLFIDNFKTVHGRKAFSARYDGTDRWLKRMNVTRDLRKSRSARASVSSRIIF